MVNWKDYIEIDPAKMAGKAVIKNTRIPVELILKKLASGDTIDDLLNSYPSLTRENVAACLLYAKATASKN